MSSPRSLAVSRFSVRASLLALVFSLSGGQARAGGGDEGDDRPPLLHGFVRLTPPDGSPSPDGGGMAHLRERGERQAIHVHVRGLEPGATYDVQVSSGDESRSLGTLTTRDDEPQPPRCFSARLSLPADDEPAGDGGHRRRPRPSAEPRGHAVFFVSREGDELAYNIAVRGLEGDVAAATLQIGDAVIELDAATLSGRVEIAPEQLAALAEGGGRVTVVAAGDEGVTLSGDIEPCISQEFRDRIARRRAGKGALRLDTRRGDEIGLDSITELVGATISVVDGEGNVALSGVVEEVVEWRGWRHRDGDGDDTGDDDTGDDGGGGLGDDAGGDDDAYFTMYEMHDASLLRGDATDDGQVGLTDAIAVLNYLFRGAAPPYCLDAADADDSGTLALSDPVLILRTLFQGATIRPPYPVKGFDRSADELFCGTDDV